VGFPVSREMIGEYLLDNILPDPACFPVHSFIPSMEL
jgi:hypothetical protein